MINKEGLRYADRGLLGACYDGGIKGLDERVQQEE